MLVETVGVGQSETAVADMVDLVRGHSSDTASHCSNITSPCSDTTVKPHRTVYPYPPPLADGPLGWWGVTGGTGGAAGSR